MGEGEEDMIQKIEIHFGALAPKIRKQLHEQGIIYPIGRDWWQQHANHITSLLISGIITDADAHRARKRIMRRINAHIKRRMGL